MSEKSNTNVVTGVARLSFANIWEPKSINGGEEKYSVSILIPKSDEATITKINNAIQTAIQEGKAKLGDKVPKNLKTPLRDGDDERPDDPNYAGHYFFNASSNNKPGVVDLNCRVITDEDEVYSGCYARVSVNFYAFNTSGNKGIAAGLNNIQKVKDGEKLSGKRSAQDDFNDGFVPEIDDDDDFLN